ncbi:DUF4099 domain-containing protein [Sunxiuqinia elliptica]|uniref:Uncharacterized protein DUF3945 n=1 Tax=Sunxiuqinia elliptica TaxID=655355 RepID=A0A4R6H0A3_9BACT|nr:DUF4099 domain-containing protein [Sunxiuqinia elliptica]TDO01393.1 uncharacterized protein DUF3945 [Sunxiuqinia elliptica]TDO57904.1 uncharacterized protein DUF3945 [Sunxiuqinia elliptica]
MTKFKLEEIPVDDMQALGLHDGQNLLLDNTQLEHLLSGNITQFVQLNNVKIENDNKVSLDAKLSLRRKPDGSAGLFIHPIYKDLKQHPDLSPEENQAFAKGGVYSKTTAAYGKIISHGEAPFEFDEGNKESYYVELEKQNGEKKFVWGIGLKSALESSRHEIGDQVQLSVTGKEQVKTQDKKGNWIEAERLGWNIKPIEQSKKKEHAVIYEYDPETKSFVSLPQEYVKHIEEINGMPLTEEQKRRYKEGKKLTMPDGTSVQASPASTDLIRSDKNLLILSMVLDGGLSYMLYRGVKAIENKGKKMQQRENEYSKGYEDALKKVQTDLERKQARFPNDKTIAQDINIVKQESTRISPSNTAGRNIESNGVNDPELVKDARERNQKNQTTGAGIITKPAVNSENTGTKQKR